MHRTAKIVLYVSGAVVFALAVAIACVFWPEPLPARQHMEPAAPLRIDHVTIVDVDTGRLIPDRSILIEGGRIAQITGFGSVADHPGVRRIDVAGQYVVPGYNNMHSHVLAAAHPAAGLGLMLSEGVTGFRQMNGSDRMLKLRRENRLPLNKDTPALLAMPGDLVLPFNVASETDAQTLVRHQKKKGADFIKIGATTPPLLYAILSAARKDAMPVLGHLPEGIDPVQASRSGFHSIEHLGPGDTMWIGCSSKKAALMAEAERHPSVGAPPFPIPAFAQKLLAPLLPKLMARRLLNPAAFEEEEDVARLQRAFDSYEPRQCSAVAQALARNGTWMVPTLVRLRSQYLQDSPEYRTDPLIPYLEPQAYRAWTKVADIFAALPERSRRTFREGYDRSLALTALLADEGVPMMTGTDGSYQTPGMSMGQEFHELARAGLSPLKILQMTTRDPAIFLDRTATMGSVAVGKNADLVILSGNPLSDVSNLGHIFGVVRSGHYHSRDDLQHIRERVASAHGRLD
ncbi:amidohydrolase family protein [Sphingobium sp. UBA5915]|uniref:amidohydrolase family protein n=1 Tax=Sphingobium sp. UBA5915 TaxID=1947530 RepID=UPI0025D556E6|nr:amidohydrolase family protein [Sphingobium sp. UBA5915]